MQINFMTTHTQTPHSLPILVSQINFMTPLLVVRFQNMEKIAIYNWKSAKIAWLGSDTPRPSESNNFFDTPPPPPPQPLVSQINFMTPPLVRNHVDLLKNISSIIDFSNVGFPFFFSQILYFSFWDFQKFQFLNFHIFHFFTFLVFQFSIFQFFDFPNFRCSKFSIFQIFDFQIFDVQKNRFFNYIFIFSIFQIFYFSNFIMITKMSLP